MTDDEFLKIFQEAHLINDTFCERDVNIAFYHSMMTQIDEVNSERHMRMAFVEFLEGLARCAHVLSLAPNFSNVRLFQL
jgi:hypothetical protein